MAGGKFNTFNKVRPGAYINTISAAPKEQADNRGTVLIYNGVSYGWGRDGVINLTIDSDFKAAIGVDVNDDKAATIKEALKGATVVKLININNGNKASGNDNSLPFSVTAKNAGTKGNEITIDVIQDAVVNTNYIIKTIFGTEVVASQTVPGDQLQFIKGNDFVDFNVTGNKLSVNGQKSVKLSGGTDKADGAAIDVIADVMQKETYQVIAAVGADVANNVVSLLPKLVADLRDNQGYKVTAVVAYNGTDFDNEAVSVVENGVIVNGNVIDKQITAAWYAGQAAGVPFNKSLTYAVYTGATAPYPAVSNQDVINSLNAGHVLFTARRDGAVVVEQDINTLQTVTDTKSGQFKKNRIVRALDEIANHVEATFEKHYIGQVTNNEDGRVLLKAAIVEYLKGLVSNGVIGAFNADDLTIVKGNTDDSVVLNYAVTPVDSMEKLYNTITVTR